MKKLILVGVITLLTFTSCQNANQNDDVLNSPKTENTNSILSREGDTIVINTEIQNEIEGAINGTNPNGKLLCSVGIGGIKGHSCLEMWGNIYQYSWNAVIQSDSSDGYPVYMHNQDGSYMYHYTFAQNSNCNCKN